MFVLTFEQHVRCFLLIFPSFHLALGVSQINEPITNSEPCAVSTAADCEVSNLERHTTGCVPAAIT